MKLLTRRQLAKELGISYSTLLKRADLPTLKITKGTYRYNLDDVLQFLRNGHLS